MAREFDYEHHCWRDEDGTFWDSSEGSERVARFDAATAKHGDSRDPQFNTDGKSKRLAASGMSVPDNSNVDMAARLNKSPAPRVTPQRIEGVITGVKFYHHGLLTICVLDLANGFIVAGENACAAPENYNRVIGEQIAYDMAKQKIWPLEGYLLRQQLHEGASNANNALGDTADSHRIVGP